MFKEKEKGNFAKIGDVDVIVKVMKLPENTVAAVRRVADDLGARNDTLMVIESGRSQLVEHSLPIYFKTRPRIPFLATTASDDDLLKNCDDDCYEWQALRSVLHKVAFAPLLQLSPTNNIQASSAVDFAVENKKHRFLVVYGNDSTNSAYTSDLVKEYDEAIQAAAKEGAVEVDKLELNSLPEERILNTMAPECVLYVGSFGQAQTLFNRLLSMKGSSQLLMILSDSVIQTRGSDAQLARGFKPQLEPEYFPYASRIRPLRQTTTNM